ncbi:hypothetical protein GPA26_10335 [Aromatoleum petrolei]|uniref:Uncharacterized protein n=1 Tax=Aromatoleum petrolei TaxID=76116 RepID=A0ABX1MSB0_9RHOO|nr:hypothetical protein [Aromatoleum petrolei]
MLTSRQIDGQTRIALVHPPSPAEMQWEARRAEEQANRAKPLPADTYTQPGFDARRYTADLADWQKRFRGDVEAHRKQSKSDPEYGLAMLRQRELSAFDQVYARSIHPGIKRLDLRRLLVEAGYSRDRRVTAPGAVIPQLLLSKEIRPVGFGGTFADGDRQVELWYMVFDDLGDWNLQDFKESPDFKAFPSEQLPPFQVTRRNAWPALVFARDEQGKLLLYGLSMELDLILSSIFNAQIF